MRRSSALPSSRPEAGLRRLLPHWVPMTFIAGFLVVIAVNGALIFFAERTFSGLETESPYERGLDYNRTLAANAAQARLGWRYEAAVSGTSGAERTLLIRMFDAEGRPLDGLKLGAYLVRPSNEGQDLALTPQPAGDGSYVAAFTLPAPGQWELRLVAHGGEVAWQQSERLFLK